MRTFGRNFYNFYGETSRSLDDPVPFSGRDKDGFCDLFWEVVIHLNHPVCWVQRMDHPVFLVPVPL